MTHISLSAPTDSSASFNPSDFSTFAKRLAASNIDRSLTNGDVREVLEKLLASPPVSDVLLKASREDVFGSEIARTFSKSAKDLQLLRSLKLLKYCYNLPCTQLISILASVISHFDQDVAKSLTAFSDGALTNSPLANALTKDVMFGKGASKTLNDIYEKNADWLLDNDPHALFPTSIYRQCNGHVTSSADHTIIEGIMGTTITTTIEIVRGVLEPKSTQLKEIYKPLGRCIAVVDERLDSLYGDKLAAYFDYHNIQLENLVYRCMEVDKDISTVEKILVDLKSLGVSRNEPVLVVGGGVMADVGGFACALYHRNTPYVMLCTSIVSGIDAGPSPRTCCDGLGYKNVFGAYHPPILTLTDRQFFKTLKPGWIRHGIAEIIKMAVTKDGTLFDDVEQAGSRLVDTKFGIENCEPGSDVDKLSERIIAKAMDCYVRSEYGNLWETHQCRPHAYGHTWSPGFELQAGLLHGHAVAIGMGYGAYLSFLEGWISESEFHRILRLMSTVGLSLKHDCLDNPDLLWSSQVKMTQKRGGNLCAPIPRGGIGKCGYLNDLSQERLKSTLLEYQQICEKYPRGGLGIEPHCKDVGLEDPSTVKQHAENAVAKGSLLDNGIENGTPEPESMEKDVEANGHCNGNGADIDTYNQWIEAQQKKRNKSKTSSLLSTNVLSALPDDTKRPPRFEHSTLFHDGAEEYASDMTTYANADFVKIAEATTKNDLFAPCMVGQVEGQFLKMLAQIKGAKRVLDIGTFTGYSALAFAEGVSKGGEVVTIEADVKCAAVARECFSTAQYGHKIRLVEVDARREVEEMVQRGERFDIVFLDADKVNYRNYYEAGLKLLNEDGILLADNALCSLVYAEDDPVTQSLHEFAQFVRADERVEQVMLTVREGILVVRKVAA